MPDLEQARCQSCGRSFTRLVRKSAVKLHCDICPVGKLKASIRKAQKSDRDLSKDSLSQIREFGPGGVLHVWAAMDKIVSLYR